MRFLPPFVLLALVGCAGRGGGVEQIVPLSPYGDVQIVGGVGFSGSTATVDFGIMPVTLEDGALTMDAAYDVTSVPDDGVSLPARRIEVTLTHYDGKPGSAYPLAGGTSVVRFHQAAADGSDRLWTAVGGEVVDGGIDASRRLLKLKKVGIAPVANSGASGTAILNGSFHIDFVAGEEPTAFSARARSREATTERQRRA